MLSLQFGHALAKGREGYVKSGRKVRAHYEMFQQTTFLISPEYHEGYAGQQAADEGPVWRQRDVIGVLGHPELD